MEKEKADLEKKKKEYLEESAAAGTKESKGGMGKYHEEEGELNKAEECYRAAADAKFAQYQYRLGVLLFRRGEDGEGLNYLRQAEKNEFDVSGELDEEIKSGKDIGLKTILERARDAMSAGSEQSQSPSR